MASAKSRTLDLTDGRAYDCWRESNVPFACLNILISETEANEMYAWALKGKEII